MRLFFTGILCIISCAFSFSQQNARYGEHVRKAEQLLAASAFSEAAREYSAAFESLGWKGYLEDRYNAARAWAMSGVPDSAFMNLFRITEKLHFDDLEAVQTEAHFSTLHTDARWPELCGKIRANQPAYPGIQKLLKNVLIEDQRYRRMTDSVEAKFGRNSPEMKQLWQKMAETDSANLVIVKSILDQYGWLGPAEIGGEGSSPALFLVIQHSDLKTQGKYLPMLREAVKNGKAPGADLALLEDRINMRNGKKQIYGSQIKRDPETGVISIHPIEDPENVDKRRAEVGLGPLSEYVSRWGLVWNHEEAEKMEKQPFEPKK